MCQYQYQCWKKKMLYGDMVFVVNCCHIQSPPKVWIESIDFPSFHSFKMSCVSPIANSLVFMLIYPF